MVVWRRWWLLFVNENFYCFEPLAINYSHFTKEKWFYCYPPGMTSCKIIFSNFSSVLFFKYNCCIVGYLWDLDFANLYTKNILFHKSKYITFHCKSNNRGRFLSGGSVWNKWGDKYIWINRNISSPSFRDLSVQPQPLNSFPSFLYVLYCLNVYCNSVFCTSNPPILKFGSEKGPTFRVWSYKFKVS